MKSILSVASNIHYKAYRDNMIEQSDIFIQEN